MPVPSSVLAAWGLRAPASQLEGGQGTSVRVGDVVLKPYADEPYVTWYAALSARTAPSNSFRLPAVVPALDGRLVVEGWTATAYTDGEPVDEDSTSADAWLPVLAAGRALHAALADEPAPPFLAARTDRWARADRVAWGAPADSLGVRSRPLVESAVALVVDEGHPSQLVHGDLSGNVLLGPGLVPTVIDLSPYRRPAAYADAVVAVDAFLWWRTDPEVLQLARPSGLSAPSWRSLLARALVFRLLAFDEPNRDPDDVATELPRYTELLALIAA